jgi:hypothetical protein
LNLKRRRLSRISPRDLAADPGLMHRGLSLQRSAADLQTMLKDPGELFLQEQVDA